MSFSISEPGKSTYAGLFLTTLSLLQLELFLTRIFSVTMWYHFAFMAISLAMFGLAKYALPQLSAPAEAWAPALGLATCATLFVAYLAARRRRAVTS